MVIKLSSRGDSVRDISSFRVKEAEGAFVMNAKNYCSFLPAKEAINATFCKSMVPGIGCRFKRTWKSLKK